MVLVWMFLMKVQKKLERPTSSVDANQELVLVISDDEGNDDH